jgi:predicted ATPase
MISIAEKEQSPVLMLIAQAFAGAIRFHMGGLSTLRDHSAEKALITPEVQKALLPLTSVDLIVLGQASEAHTLWFLGHADQARQEGQKAAELAEQLAHPVSQVLALSYLAMLLHFCRQVDAAKAQAEAALALAIQREATFYRHWAPIIVQWAIGSMHPGPAELSALRQAIDEYCATGARLRLPYYLSLLADIYAKAGQPAEALATIDEALTVSTKQNERWWDAELYRLRGELLLLQGAEPQQVEAAFQQALTFARHQQGRTLELRAATSLARFWRQSRREQAGQLLSAIYRQFDEGFDTLDLQEAKALLAEIS